MPGQHFPALLEQVPPALFKCGYSLILELSEKKGTFFFLNVKDFKKSAGPEGHPGEATTTRMTQGRLN